MLDTTIKVSELSSKNVLVTNNTQFLILDKGTVIQSPNGSTMTTPASAVIALVANAYNLNNLATLYTGVSTNSAKNLSNYTTVNTNSATWTNHITNTSVHVTSAERLLLDNLSVNATELNYSSGLVGNIQEQFGNVGDGIASINSSISTLQSEINNALIKTYIAPPQQLTSDQCYNGVIYLTANSAEVVLPPVAEGMSLSVVPIGGVNVFVCPDAADAIYFAGSSLGDNVCLGSYGSTDRCIFTYYSADGWWANGSGGWAGSP